MNIDSTLVIILVVLVIAFLAISIVAIHWIIVNSQDIGNNAAKIQRAVDVNKMQDVKINNNTKINIQQDSEINHLKSTIRK